MDQNVSPEFTRENITPEGILTKSKVNTIEHLKVNRKSSPNLRFRTIHLNVKIKIKQVGSQRPILKFVKSQEVCTEFEIYYFI